MLHSPAFVRGHSRLDGPHLLLDGSVGIDIVGPRGDEWGGVVTSTVPPPRVTDQGEELDITMSLTGTYHRTLDDKQRLAVPKRLRDDLCSEEKPVVYVAPETEQALTLYSTAEFQRRAEKLARSIPQHTTLRNYHRLYYSQAEQLEVDAQGRIRLPERLVQFAGLTQDVVLLGVHDHVEIWDRSRWQHFLDQHASGFDALAHAALGETTTTPGTDDEASLARDIRRIPR